MAQEYSFDIVSEANLQQVDNALNTVKKEILSRYDFRGSTAEIARENLEITIKAEDDYKMGAIEEMLRLKAIKQQLDTKFFDFSKEIEESLGGNMKKIIPIKNGIDKEKAKQINGLIKDLKLKVNSQIQNEQIRVSSRDKDMLQKVMQSLKGANLDIPLIFTNFR